MKKNKLQIDVHGHLMRALLCLSLFLSSGVSAAIFSVEPTSQSGNITLSFSSNTYYFVYFREVFSSGAQTTLKSYTGTPSSGSFNVSKSPGTYQFLLVRCQRYTGGSPGGCIYSDTKTVVVSSQVTIPSPSAPVLATPPSYPSSFDSHTVIPGNFNVNLSGQATYSVPVPHEPTGGNFGPNVSLEYSSGAGNGLAGYGWSIGGLGKINRCRQTRSQDGTVKPIRWNSEDRYCLNGARLLVESGNYGAPGSTYRTEVDQYLKVKALGGTTGNPDYFQVEYKNGIIEKYSVKHHLVSGTSTRLYAWYLQERKDSAGNKMLYSYQASGGGAAPRISIIDYAYDREYGDQNATMEFFWEDRPDVISGYVSGYYYENRHRLTDIHTNGSVGMKYELHYSQETGYSGYYADKASRLVQISRCVSNRCGKPLKFEWPIPSDPVMNESIDTDFGLTYLSVTNPTYVLGDISGNGLPDIAWNGGGTVRTAFASVNSSGKVSYTNRSVVGGSISLSTASRLQLVDYDGDGRVDLVTRAYESGGGLGNMTVFFSRPQSDGTWAIEKSGSVSLTSGTNGAWTRSSFVDLNADGLVDTVDPFNKYVMVQKSSQPGSYYGQKSITFSTQGAPSGIVVSRIIPNSMGDFNGDGSIDFVVSTSSGHGYVAYVSEPTSSGGLTLKYFGAVSSSIRITGTDNYHFRVVDLNGDGLGDVVYEQNDSIKYRLSKGGSGFSAVKSLPLESEWKYTTIVDRNSDGYPDMVYLIGNPAPSSMFLSVRYWDPEVSEFRSYRSNTALSFDGFPLTFGMQDVNGDGEPDLFMESPTQRGIYILPSGDLSVGNRIKGIYRTDSYDADIEISYDNLGQSKHYSFVNKVSSSTSAQVCQSTYSGNSCWNREIAASSRSALMSKESSPFSGLSGHDQIIESSPFFRVFNVNTSMPVVTQVSRRQSAGLPDTPGFVSVSMTPVKSFYYEQGQVQAAGRGFLGFKKRIEVDRLTGMRRVSTLRRDWPFSGREVKFEVFTRTGRLINKLDTAWALADCSSTCLNNIRSDVQSGGTAIAEAIQPFKKRTESRTYDLNGAGLFGRNVTVIGQDKHGNVLTELETIYDGLGALLLTRDSTNTYTLMSGGNYSMTRGRLTKQTVESTNGSGSKVRETDFEYYASGSAAGLLWKEVLEPNQSEFTVEVEHFYDAFGNRTKSNTKADGVTRFGERTEYDYLGRYPNKVYGYRTGGTETGQTEYLKTHYVSRDRFGTPTNVRSYISSTNYVTERVGTTYFGRVYFRSDSTGRRVDVTLGTTHSNCPSGNLTYRYELSAEQDGSQSLACFDHHDREIRKAQKMLNGSWSGIDREFDKYGRQSHESRPVYLSGSRQWMTTKYDVLGRPTEIRSPDGSTSYIAYSRGMTTTTNALGHSREEAKNPLGQVIQTTGELPGTDIFYGYDARGNLTSMTGPSGVTSIAYDLLDRKETMTDPDKGTWFYKHNKFGELTCQTDAKGQHIVHRYDRRGRIFNRRDASSGTCGSPTGIQGNTTWTYDTATYGYGQLSIVRDSVSNYEQQIYYDSRGRFRQARTRIPGVNNQLENHYEKITYNQYGQVFQVYDAARNGTSYSDNVVQNVYKNGFLEKVIDAVHVGGTTRKTYYDARTMDAEGNVLQAIYGNGVTQRATFNSRTGRVENLRAQNSMGKYIQNLDLEWDDVGNLERREETGIGSGIGARSLIETYTYDPMNRLESWTSSGVFNGTENYDHDSKDNIVFKTGIGSYKYGSQCSSSYNAGPHAVCQAGSTTYTYDNNGNQISGGGRTTTYTVFNKPLSIAKSGHTTQFSYGPERNRYKRVDTNGSSITTTLYLGNVEKIYYPNGTVHWKRSVAGGTAVLSQTLNSGGSVTKEESHYFIKDHLGSLSLVTDHQGGVTHELYSDPWGQPRKPVWNGTIGDYTPGVDTPYLKLATTVTQRGFTGHEHADEVGVIHMNGRIYDPRLARFMQADPLIQDPTTSRSLNRYSYVWNNPLNATDPSGYTTEQRTKDAQQEAQEERAQRGDSRRRQDSLDGLSAEAAMFHGMAALGSGRYDVSLSGKSESSFTGSGAIFDMMVGDALSSAVFYDLVGTSAKFGGSRGVITGHVRPVTLEYSAPVRSERRSAQIGASITEDQMALARNGEYLEFWRSRHLSGDPVARVALTGWGDPDFVDATSVERLAARYTWYKLRSHITSNSLTVSMEQIGSELALAHAYSVMGDGRGIPHLLSPRQVAAYHHDVFGRHGIPPHIFGGTLAVPGVSVPVQGGWGPVMFDANTYSGRWCRGCDSIP